MDRLVNLTPHDLHFWTGDGERCLTLGPAGLPARLAERAVPVAMLELEGFGLIPLVERRWGEIENLPEPVDGVIYVVSLPVAEAAHRAGRRDVASPGGMVRDAEGRVTGCTTLVVA